jgi:hypothetical protein
VLFPTQTPQRNASKTFPRNLPKTPKMTKKEKKNMIHKQIKGEHNDELQTFHSL